MPPSDPIYDRRTGWAWDPTLYAGSAAHYVVGRVAYPEELAERLVDALGLNASGSLLDVGCGPGSLTLLLARHFADAIGVDADPDMLQEAARAAREQGASNVTWRHLRAERLPADIPPVRVVTFAQSFHWMERPRVAAAARHMLEPGGAVVHVHASTHEGVTTDEALPHRQPPRAAIKTLVAEYLGQQRRAGQGYLPHGLPGGEEEIYRTAGFVGPDRLEIPGRVVTRTAGEVVASVYSLSSSAPHLFGDRLSSFDRELHESLADASDEGMFSEQLRPIRVEIWR